MTTSYQAAVVTLYQAPHDAFVSERKRLSAELKAGGDKAGAQRLAKLARPTVSAWAVNQLWWRERDAFQDLLASAERLQDGDLNATGAHREALVTLRTHAAALLREAGHAANEATLRRIATTLSALAVAGGFEPDPPGALASDRDPPGFDGTAFAAPVAPRTTPRSGEVAPTPTATSKQQLVAERARQRAEAEAAQRAAEERRQKQLERKRVEASLQIARREHEARARDVERIQADLSLAQDRLEQTRATLSDLEARLAALGDGHQ